VAPSAQTTFLDPVVLGKIGDLALVARTVVSGFLHGMHRSFHSGQSLDFAQHRPYQPGDDLRRIDWRVYGRTDKFFLKTYESDTNASAMFAVDVSGSMDYGSIGITKFQYARILAASLAWLAQKQGDRVGLVTLTADLRDVVPPSTRHLQLLLHTLGRAKPSGEGQLPEALGRLSRSKGKPGILVLISDCYEEPDALGKALGALRARGFDLIVFHLIDPAERDLPFDAPGTFEDAETGMRLALQPEELREKYKVLLTQHREQLQRVITNQGADYVSIETDQPLDSALHTYLDKRLMGSAIR
jgi:uncharacterized protein (DUF58 family)